jgi:hypothetical protein
MQKNGGKGMKHVLVYLFRDSASFFVPSSLCFVFCVPSLEDGAILRLVNRLLIRDHCR